MPTRNFAANKSSLFADGSSNLGGGADDHMPVGGPYSGYTFRSAVRFALNFADMKSISSAILYLRTSSQVHVAFSSDPDIVIARCSSDWTANSASGSSDGGGGWSTSPTVYPGPNITTAGQVTKDVSTAESTWITADITQIVRDWAPASVAGGGGAANYGVRLAYAASGDVTEFNSYRASSGQPYIVVTYATDAAPVCAMDGPSGIVATTRPTLSGTASDPDGDPITNVHIEVSQGATIVYAVDLGAVGASWSHVPTIDLPGGALTARAVSGSTNLSSAWSNVVSFTVDRPPVMGVFSAPPATGSNRRPTIVVAYSDPDGNVADNYGVEVYATSGGVATGSPVYSAYYQTAGIAASSITHTPTIDLPGGPLVVRVQVRAGPANLWSSWSVDYPFMIALTSPTIAWIYPAAAGAYMPVDWLDHLESAFNEAYGVAMVEIRPPAGQTLTRLRLWISGVATDPSVSGGTLVYDLAPDPVGGTFSYGLSVGARGSTIYSTAWEATASGGGVTKAWRPGRIAAVEWIGRLFLGDNVTALDGVPSNVGMGAMPTWVRAENAAGAALSAWGPYASALAALPAQGAYLGMRQRAAYLGPDADMLIVGGAEQFGEGYTTLPPGWYINSGAGTFGTSSGHVVAGSLAYNGRGPVTVVSDGYIAQQLVVPSKTYKLSGWRLREAWSDGTVTIWIGFYTVGYGWIGGGAAGEVLQWNTGQPGDAWVYREAWITTPPNAWACTIVMTFTGGSDWVDEVKLVGPKVGAAGLDKWRIDWTSAG